MNLYIRSVGFKDFSSDEEAKFLKNAIKNSENGQNTRVNKKYKRALLLYSCSDTTGIGIYGRIKDERFVYDHHFPYVLPGNHYYEGDILVRRNRSREGFQGVIGNTKAGGYEIFHITNSTDLFNYMENEGHENGYELVGLGGIHQLIIKASMVTFSAVALSGIIILPVMDKKNPEKDVDNDIFKDLLSFVDTILMPNGPECEGYALTGEIIDYRLEENIITEEVIYILTIHANKITMDVAVNKDDVLGEPGIGRRFRGSVMLQGYIWLGNKYIKL